MKAAHALDHSSGVRAEIPGTRQRAARAAPRMWHFVLEYMLALPVGAAIALAWANVAPESYYMSTYAIAFAVNDVAMALFFGWITKEIVEATLPGGILHPWQRALAPVVASLGLVIVPVATYGATVRIAGEPMLEIAWPATLATDLAFAYVIARLIFRDTTAIPFLLLLVIAADGIGFIALAVFGQAHGVRPAIALPMAGAAASLVALLRIVRVRSFWPYVLAGGTLSWCALYFAGLHPAFALLPVVAFLPHGRRDPGFFVDAPAGARDALSRFEIWCRHPAQIALFLFGLVNAGVPLRALELGAISLPLATLVGKPLGLLAGAGLAIAVGLPHPRHIGWRELVVMGCLSGVGFSLALFFAEGTLGVGQVLNETRMGALLSVGSAAVALCAARALRVGRFAR
jgi:NhaA family Na+:H+ antiporter